MFGLAIVGFKRVESERPVAALSGVAVKLKIFGLEPEMVVECFRKVSAGEPWLDRRETQWVLQAYRTQGTRTPSSRSKVQLTPKESLIVSCVTQGMKNKEIAVRVGTTEQVVKNYLRKVYDKLGVADRLELALYCLQHRVVDGTVNKPATETPDPHAGNGSAQDVPPVATPESVS